MLAIDDLKKLAEMQIHLLKISTNDREFNLKKYKDLVVQIDEYNFKNFLSSLDQLGAHNQTLEIELQNLEQIRESYQQLLEQQLLFKKNCELYGDDKIQLFDLSVIDIDYINIRINNINSYLINKLNLDNCRNKLQKLNEELLIEEKNRQLVCDKLLQLENFLRTSFLDAEGRIVLNGELKYISVVSEYNDLGYNVKELLDNKSRLDELIFNINEELFDAEEKLKVAEICYKSDFNNDSMNVLNEIKLETLKIRYKSSMLKILELLSLTYNDYNLFKKKREDLLSLIKYRLDCLNGLGIHMSIDPFSRIKVVEQLDTISSFGDNIENICRIKNETVELDSLLEQLNLKNDEYRIQLRNTKEIVKLNEKKDDVDVDIKDEIDDDVNKILDNQVISISEISTKFNKDIVSQKTDSVIKRVREMVDFVLPDVEETAVVNSSPELVIVHDSINTNANVVDLEHDIENETFDSVDSLFDNFSLSNSDDINEKDENIINEIMDEKKEEILDLNNNVGSSVVMIDENISNEDLDIFVTVDPFVETPLFSDRIDEEIKKDDFVVSVDNIVEEEVVPVNTLGDEVELQEKIDNLDLSIEEEKIDDLKDEMPDAFWVVEDNEDDKENEEFVLSFDEQVNKLMEDDIVKKKKLVA